ncbi:MAG TPA: hypothetical protein VGG75_27140 [Trebonia sp.]
MADDLGDAEAGCIDLSGFSLDDLGKLGDSVLSHELRRMLLSESGTCEPSAGFDQRV